MKTCKTHSSCADSDLGTKNSKNSAPNNNSVISLSAKDLPLACPRPNDSLWSMHPRVFLPIEESENQTITCPYCSTTYELKETQ